MLVGPQQAFFDHSQPIVLGGRPSGGGKRPQRGALASGQMGPNPANTTDYIIKGYGRSALLTLQLTNG